MDGWMDGRTDTCAVCVRLSKMKFETPQALGQL